jgi:hypothetical protein
VLKLKNTVTNEKFFILPKIENTMLRKKSESLKKYLPQTEKQGEKKVKKKQYLRTAVEL